MKLPPLNQIVIKIVYWTCIAIAFILSMSIVIFYAWKAKQVCCNVKIIFHLTQSQHLNYQNFVNHQIFFQPIFFLFFNFLKPVLTEKFVDLKFIFSEKATKFCKIFILLLFYVVPVKSKVMISQNFVTFSEYMTFTNKKFIFSAKSKQKKTDS